MQEVVQEKEFLRGYEVKNWNFSPRIYKILAASVILNLAAVMIFAQTNLLTKKGCDSPFVSTVCDVIATVYVGNSLFGTDGEYVVRDYNKTEIGEDEEVTFIDVSNMTPPISYPPGYFAVANPDQYRLDENGMVVPNTYDFENMTPPNSINPTIPNNPAGLMNTTPNFPKPGKNPTTENYPDSPFKIGDNPTVNNPTTARKNNRKGGKNPTIPDESPDKLPKLDGDETADKNTEEPVDEKTAKTSESVKEVEINKKPLQDFADDVLVKVSNTNEKKVDLKKSFKVVMNGVLNEEGKLIVDKSKFTPLKPEEAGDPEMEKIAKDAIMAVGDSGFLKYLSNLGAKNIKISLEQNPEGIIAIVESEQKDANQAKSLASLLNAAIVAAPSLFKLGEDEKFLLKSAEKKENRPTNNGKIFIMKFEISGDDAHEMIERNLKKAAERKKEEKNSTAQTVNSNVNTGK